MSPALLAGSASTVLFVASTLPMVVRAARTKDVTSYSRGHLVMTNTGNLVHSLYVASLPLGPIWLLHGVHVGVSAFMLGAHLLWAPSLAPKCDGSAVVPSRRLSGTPAPTAERRTAPGRRTRPLLPGERWPARPRPARSALSGCEQAGLTQVARR